MENEVVILDGKIKVKTIWKSGFIRAFLYAYVII